MSKPNRTLSSIRLHVLAGGGLALAFAGNLCAWSVFTEISGAVIAPGLVVVESHVKKVQHPHGGVVSEINVRNGDRVRPGQPLVRLDETVLRANLQVITKNLDELAARQARLESERDGAEAMIVPAALAARAADSELGRMLAGEQRLFDLRRKSRTGQRAQLQERIAQIEQEVSGVLAQLAAKAKEIELITRELEGVRDLHRKQLVTLPRLTQLERDAARIEGERGQLVASAAQAKARIAEIRLQILQIDQDLRSEVAKELRDIQAKSAELEERRVAADDQLKRTDIKAPVAGVVHQLAAHTVGGVIAPGEQVMLIVPDSESLAVEAKVSPQDIDQVRAGQAAVMRISAFNQATTPELNGTVTLVSADLVTEPRTGVGYYTIRVSLPAQEIARLGAVRLLPGMQAEAYVQTGVRSVASYLLKPVRDQLARAFRER